MNNLILFTFSSEAEKKTRTALKTMLLVCFALPLVAIAIDRLFPLPQEKLNPPSSTLLLDKDGNLLRAFLAPDEMWRLRVESDDISPLLKKATLAYEDRHFRYHPGVNPISIVRAAVANIRAGKVAQGGSTITMQVARLIEPKERTIGGKLIEVWRALQLEAHYSKDEILTYYFNLAPYGGNLVGIGAASRVYFNKPPDKLSPGEAALLAAIPNSPNRNRPDVSSSSATKARDKVLRSDARTRRD
ncbi:MAG: transglycosylase domain-containing protein [bacterium]|nr:transglycosylase domain-containing protein [bacterium]